MSIMMLVALSFGPIAQVPAAQNGAQRADPDFVTKVAKPAYAADRHPVVLFDEAHRNFHTASGRYKAFADLVTSDGYLVKPNRQPFTAASLAGADILLIANATGGGGIVSQTIDGPAFTEAEADAVLDWVEAGGSLFLITDHPPYGSPSANLAKRLGVEMSQAMTEDQANTSDRAILFSRDKKHIGDHAITQGRDNSERVTRVLTFAGQSLKGPTGSVALLKFADSAYDRRPDSRITSAAGRAQGIALVKGNGRVVVMGEAGQLSAQVYGIPPQKMGMNVPGSDNRQFALNTMHWLSKLID